MGCFGSNYSFASKQAVSLAEENGAWDFLLFLLRWLNNTKNSMAMIRAREFNCFNHISHIFPPPLRLVKPWVSFITANKNFALHNSRGKCSTHTETFYRIFLTTTFYLEINSKSFPRSIADLFLLFTSLVDLVTTKVPLSFSCQ